MKLEIEITEDEIKSAVMRKIRVAVADESNSWRADNHIKQRVKDLWTEAVDLAIAEVLADLPAIKDRIAKAVEGKLRGQITALMKVKP